ncbi:MAG TPA: tetratricopeptide repeat protein, partial [Dehalococcoidia bacterium]|nr:tetratricopeptide repeat protein [Dehalococcoidia bacterium]
MPEDWYDEPERRAAEKVLAAERLEARGRLREALDALNLAIQLAPSSPRAFERRASVFERLGLWPQAEADRQRAAALAAALPSPQAVPSPSEPDEPQPEPAPPAPKRRTRRKAAEPDTGGVPEPAEDAVPKPREAGETVAETPPAPQPAHYYGPIPSDIPREPGGGVGVSRSTILVVAAFLVTLVIGIAVVFAALSLGGSGGPETSGVTQPTGVATGGGSVTPTGEPGATGAVSTSGSPYTLSGLVSAWKAKGLEVKTGGAAQGFTGFKTAPVDVTMTRSGST